MAAILALVLPAAQVPAGAADGAGAPVVSGFSPRAGYTIYDQITLTGANLAQTTAVSVAGKPAQFQVIADSMLSIELPHLAPGAYQLSITSPAGTTLSAGTYQVASLEAEVLRLVNIARAKKRKCGKTTYKAVKPVKLSPLLSAVATAHSTDMATKDYFSHYSKSGGTPFTRMKAAGYRYSSAGENIAAGYGSPAATVAAWIKSPGHCKNIMKKTFTQMGVGYAEGGTYGDYWTQDFGKPKK